MNRWPPACVVFDLDDTLFLEREYVRSGVAAVTDVVAARFGRPDFHDVAWEAFEQGVRGRLFDHALDTLGLDADADIVAELVEVYRRHTPRIALLDDAATAIAGLQAAGVTIAVISDGPVASQRAKAEALGAGDWAAAVVLTSELGPGKGKPDPAGFALVEEALGVVARDCVYVADNPVKDFAAPARRGWATARVRRPGSLHELVPSGADVDREDGDLRWISGDARRVPSAGVSMAVPPGRQGAPA